MRVLHVIGKLDPGGVETWLVQLLKEVDRAKCSMDVLVHSDRPGAYDEEVRRSGAKIIICPGNHNPVLYALNFSRALHKNGPYDIVHSHVHLYSGFVALLAKANGVPSVIAHSHSDVAKKKGPVSFPRKVYQFVMRKCILWFASGGLAVSRVAGTALFGKHWKPSRRWALQHLGIDLTRFFVRVNPHEMRRSLDIPDGALIVGHVGSFRHPKNHAFLVKIAQEIVKRDKSAHFLFVGDGPLRPYIQQLVETAGIARHVVFTGQRRDIPALMKGAMDVLLFPSLWEGLPITLLEAQAAGLRSLISDTITPEVESVPGSIWRESLSTCASRWAERLLELSALPRCTVSTEDLKSHSISASVEALLEYYGQFTSGSTATRRAAV